MGVMNVPPPAVIGRYEIERELGRGTMGVVYRARDPRYGRAVAVKTISPDVALSSVQRVAFENRFFAEGRIAAGLSHPGIVKVHEIGCDLASRTLFLALEYVQGRTLQELMESGPLPWRDALTITARMADALDHAHARGVVHRDIKPANIMLLPTGEPKLMDFGLARLENARYAPTLTGQVFGTPLYMSPEQAQGENVDGRSDLFSLGAILYTLLTGRRAFGADNIPASIKRIVYEDPAAPTRIAPDLPSEVDDLVARLLSKRPSARHPTGYALSAHIADVLAAAPRRILGAPRLTRRARLFEAADFAHIDALFERLWRDVATSAALTPPLGRTPPSQA